MRFVLGLILLVFPGSAGSFIFPGFRPAEGIISGIKQRVIPIPQVIPPIIVGPGEYQVFFLDQKRHLFGLGTNLNTLGVGGPAPTGTSGTSGMSEPAGTSRPSGTPELLRTPGMPLRVRVVPSDLTFKTVAGGLHGGAAIDTNGHVWTFGDNGQGQYGNGTKTFSSGAVRIDVDSLGAPFDHVTQVCAYFSGNSNNGWYAIKDDGSLWVWGSTLNGMRGNGTTGGANLQPVRISIPGSRRARQVVAGGVLVLLCTDGSVWTCGGDGKFPQNLGYAATGTDYLTLHRLTGLANITQVAGGAFFNYALRNDGTLYGWGVYGSYLGYPAVTGGGIPVPAPTILTAVMQALPDKIASIVTNSVCTHALLTDGSLWGWGDNAQGTVGTGSELDYTRTHHPYAWDFRPGVLLQQLPARIVHSRSDFTTIFGSSVFTFYTYAETVDGTLYSWGRNKGAVLGNGVVGCLSEETAAYPNSWDVPEPAIVNPLGLNKVNIVVSPYCRANPDSPACSRCSLARLKPNN